MSTVSTTPKESIVTNVSPDSSDPEINQSTHRMYVSPVSAISDSLLEIVQKVIIFHHYLVLF